MLANLVINKTFKSPSEEQIAEMSKYPKEPTCMRDQIVNLLQEKHAAYDAHGVHSLLAREYDVVEEQLEAANAAPSTLNFRLVALADGTASTVNGSGRR